MRRFLFLIFVQILFLSSLNAMISGGFVEQLDQLRTRFGEISVQLFFGRYSYDDEWNNLMDRFVHLGDVARSAVLVGRFITLSDPLAGARVLQEQLDARVSVALNQYLKKLANDLENYRVRRLR